MSSSLTITRAVLVMLISSGCDFQKSVSQATAKTVAISTLLSTPAVEIRGAAVAGYGFDAGMLHLDAGTSIPAQNKAFVFFGQRQGNALDSPPIGVAGASARLIEVGGQSFSLEDQGSGTYAFPAETGFSYTSNATYQLEFTFQSEVYVTEVKQVPSQEVISEFHPAQGFIELNPLDSLTFTRTAQERHIGFVSVFPVNIQGTQGQPTYTNIPSTPLGFLKLVLTPDEWKTATNTIPGSAFPDRDSNYLVIFQNAKVGAPLSDNLFTSSAILAGTGDVGIVKTKK